MYPIMQECRVSSLNKNWTSYIGGLLIISFSIILYHQKQNNLIDITKTVSFRFTEWMILATPQLILHFVCFYQQSTRFT